MELTCSLRRWSACLWVLFVPYVYAGSTASVRVQYQSPVAGAIYVPTGTNIIIRLSERVDASDLSSPSLIRVEGSRSGLHPGNLDLADDGQTVLFRPYNEFAAGEAVTVTLPRGIRSRSGSRTSPYTFDFTISRVRLPQPGTRSLETELPPSAAPAAETPAPKSSRFSLSSGDTLPLDFPFVNVTTSGTVSPGRIFLSNFRFFGDYAPYLLILDNSGAPVFYRKMRPNDECLDFKVQPNGLLTYFEGGGAKFYAMDSSYAIVDSFMMDGYTTDLHEFRLLPNGHALLMSSRSI